MAFIKFNDKTKPVKAQAKKLNKNQIEITGCDINTSGFSYYQDAEMKRKYGDFDDFKTLYRELDESYILSNNGSVYPETVEPEETPQPTLRETVASLSGDITNAQAAIAKNYEQCVVNDTELTNVQMAVTELYEMILGGV